MAQAVNGGYGTSRTHALFTAQQGSWEVEDLKTVDGTFVDGDRVSDGPRRLRSGDVIRLGKLVGYLVFEE